MKKLALLILFLAETDINISGQKIVDTERYSELLTKQLMCRSNPKAGRVLMNMQRKRLISPVYVVSDSVSYFRLNKPLTVLGFRPLAVFGFEQGYPEFFARGPGTAPPEMVGIVVRDSLNGAKAKLRKLGIQNLQVEELEFDLKGHANTSGPRQTSISCWERY